VRAIGGLILLVGAALLLRSTALSVLSARGVVLDVLAFVTVVWSLRWGENWGSSFGFVLGLGADLDAAHWLGRHALALALVGYATGRLSRGVVRDNPVTQFLLILAATLVHQGWALTFEFGGLGAWPVLTLHVLVAGAATAACGVLLLGLARLARGQSLFNLASAETGPKP
jgi:rod shape-determining protein MreD